MSDYNLTEIDVFHYQDGNLNFNDLCNENGYTHWFARDLMKMLGYAEYNTFYKAINKAIGTCMTLGIPVEENFTQIKREVEGLEQDDYKISRFACYLVVMNGDNKKYQVAKAQAFFATAGEAIRRYVNDSDDVERVIIREELSAHEKSLSTTAQMAGVERYDLFRNAGYRGMYNMNLNKLKDYKGIPNKNKTLLDFMGKDELAANLFRITQTDLKMKNEGVTGQEQAEKTAEEVGQTVRRTMIEISGVKPESMAIKQDIKKVKTSLKQTAKGLGKIDKK